MLISSWQSWCSENWACSPGGHLATFGLAASCRLSVALSTCSCLCGAGSSEHPAQRETENWTNYIFDFVICQLHYYIDCFIFRDLRIVSAGFWLRRVFWVLLLSDSLLIWHWSSGLLARKHPTRFGWWRSVSWSRCPSSPVSWLHLSLAVSDWSPAVW